MARKAIRKGLRFEVFKRDHFTCQYCGAQPPAVVLVVDHITPVIKGGESTIDNLVTACEPCNQGKAGKPLERIHVRPDADLLYLETQQEIAELERYRRALTKKERALKKTVQALQDVWCEVSALEWAPADSVLRSLIDRHSLQVVERAIRDVGPKVAGGYVGADKWPGYLAAVARNMEGEGS